MWFVMVCFILLSGLFTPVRSMPEWAQLITLADPLRFFIDGMRTVFIRGAGFTSIILQLSTLFGFAVIINLWAVQSYRKNSCYIMRITLIDANNTNTPNNANNKIVTLSFCHFVNCHFCFSPNIYNS
jgi:hypothetical protein